MESPWNDSERFLNDVESEFQSNAIELHDMESMETTHVGKELWLSLSGIGGLALMAGESALPTLQRSRHADRA